MHAIPAAKVVDNPLARHRAAPGGSRGHDRALAEISLADRHRSRLLPGLRDARHLRSHHLQRDCRDPVGCLAALRCAPLFLGPLRPLRPGRHLHHLRIARRYRLGPMADTGPVPGLLAGLRGLRPYPSRCLAAAPERHRFPAALRRQVVALCAARYLAARRRRSRPVPGQHPGARARGPLAARGAPECRPGHHRDPAQAPRSVGAPGPVDRSRALLSGRRALPVGLSAQARRRDLQPGNRRPPDRGHRQAPAPHLGAGGGADRGALLPEPCAGDFRSLVRLRGRRARGAHHRLRSPTARGADACGP